MRWHLLAAGLVLACLLCYDLGGRELWTDEGYSLSASGPLPEAAFGDASHPPGYQLLLHYWLHLSPSPSFELESENWLYAPSDGWLRAFSIPWALLAWWLGWLVAARLGLKREGLLAAWLMALSPLVLTYFRIGRYYSMTAALTMLCLLALVWLWERPGWRRGLILGLTVALVGYTDYTALVLVLVIFFLGGLLSLLRRDIALLYALGGAAASASVLMAPLALLTVRRAAAVAAITADPMAHSLRGAIIKLALPVFSLATGECVDPWRWAITVPALVATVVLLVVGLVASRFPSPPAPLPETADGLRGEGGPRRQIITRDHLRLLALAWPLNIIIATLMLSTVAANVPPNRVTSLSMFTIPLAYLTLARGLTALRARWLALACLMVLISMYAYGDWNYFHREQLLNPGYAIPWRETARVIEQHEQPGRGQIILLDEGFHRYYHGTLPILQGQYAPLTIREWEAGATVPTGPKWLIARDRGSATLLDETERVKQILIKRGYQVQQVYRIQPRTPQQQRMLSMVLRRPAADAYVKVYLLERREPGIGDGERGRR